MVARGARRSGSLWLRITPRVTRLITARLNSRRLRTPLGGGPHNRRDNIARTEITLTRSQKSASLAKRIKLLPRQEREVETSATDCAPSKTELQIGPICAKTSAFRSRGLGRSMTSVEKERRESGVGSSKLYPPDVYVSQQTVTLSVCERRTTLAVNICVDTRLLRYTY